MIDVVRHVWIEIAERVIRERRKVDDRIESSKVRLTHVSNVATHVRNAKNALFLERGGGVEIAIETDDLMPSAGEQRYHQCADKTQMPGNKNSHDIVIPLRTSVRA